jgi:hypothetical protein
VPHAPLPACGRAHAACLGRWLDKAHTCPTCRFALPVDGAPLGDEWPALVERAGAELKRLRAATRGEGCLLVPEALDAPLEELGVHEVAAPPIGPAPSSLAPPSSLLAAAAFHPF